MFLRQKHVVNSLMKLAPDLDPNCLQRLSADDKSCHYHPDFSHELYHRYISILVTFMYRGNYLMLSQLPWVLTLVFKNASLHLGVEMLNSQVGKSFIWCRIY